VPNPDGSFPDVIRTLSRRPPAGQIWVISDFKADVKVNGSKISVDGRGLLLGGGNTIGTNGNASVFATLICEATPPFIDTARTLRCPAEVTATSGLMMC
jgi:hypothetical protein